MQKIVNFSLACFEIEQPTCCSSTWTVWWCWILFQISKESKTTLIQKISIALSTYMNVLVLFSFTITDHQKCGPFEEQYFIGVNNLGKNVQVFLQLVHIWNERIDNGRPSFVKCLVPNWSAKTCTIERLRYFLQVTFTLFKYLSIVSLKNAESIWHLRYSYNFSLILLNQIHFVNQAKDLGVFRVFHNSFQTVLIIMYIPIKFSWFDVKYINQNFDIFENVLAKEMGALKYNSLDDYW